MYIVSRYMHEVGKYATIPTRVYDHPHSYIVDVGVKRWMKKLNSPVVLFVF